MKTLHHIALLVILILFCSFTFFEGGRFSIKAHVSGFADNTPVLLIEAETSTVKDTAYIKNNHFEFAGTAGQAPKNVILYIPMENEVKYTYLFMADEDVIIEGSSDDFPNKLLVKGSIHHSIKTNYDQRVAKYDEQLNFHRNKILELQSQNKWNDSLQRAYIGENGILKKLDEQKTEEEKRFVSDHINSYYGLQVLYWKRTKYADKDLKKLFSKFSKEFQNTKNGKAIQAYLANPEIKKGQKYTDFSALDRSGNSKTLSGFFDGKHYVLLDFSTPTCSNSVKALSMLQYLNKEHSDKLTVVSFYVEDKKEHFDYFSNQQINPWEFLWTQQGNEGFPYIRYRINSTPTYYLFNPDGKLLEKWSGFFEGYYDATQSKIEKLIGIK